MGGAGPRRGGRDREPLPQAATGEGLGDLGEGVVHRRVPDGPEQAGEAPAFENLPRRRWVAERTFAWIGHNRRMAKDQERLCSTGEAFIHAAMARLMARRLARA